MDHCHFSGSAGYQSVSLTFIQYQPGNFKIYTNPP
jgi:hypothetical protein